MAWALHGKVLVLLLGYLGLVAADLRTDLRDFAALVPRRRIAHIAARHYVFDQRFRQAMQFIRSDEFLQIWKEIRAAPDVADLLGFLTVNGSGYDVSSVVDMVPNRLHSFQIPRLVPVQMMLQRDLTTFLREVVQSLPRAKFYSLAARKVHEGGEFALLYKALRSQKFRDLMHSVRHSPDLKTPLDKLSEQYINVDEIIQMTFELIGWGPQTT
ncbi:uncharacterized protein LOC115633654 [Scaptodrosophila lebanonensis]|uniref:Uncharacterized protein LOC115633654 n=1 Tax=Drosophila lebanonensis TaxID=7225 RepID=A0A6J2UHM1_DROLE|nr:uncharacterized protein LOC115633654 [Scaptodrosophila lebanonensis]